MPEQQADDFLDTLPIGEHVQRIDQLPAAPSPPTSDFEEDDLGDELPGDEIALATTATPARPKKKVKSKVSAKATAPTLKRKVKKKKRREAAAAPVKSAHNVMSSPDVPRKKVTFPGPTLEKRSGPVPTREEFLEITEGLQEVPTHDTLPAPEPDVKSAEEPVQPPTAATMPMAEIDPNQAGNVNKRWDEFLLSLNDATRMNVWEMGVNSLTEFEQYSFQDLMRPRGRLTEQQAEEVRKWLKAAGIELSKTSNIRMQRGGPSAVRTRRAREPLPENATLGQQRTHRLQGNRLTM